MKPSLKPLEALILRLPECGFNCWKILRKLIVLLLIGILGLELWRHQLAVMQWDLLLLSGFVALLIGWHFLREFPERFRHSFKRLRARRTIVLTDQQAADLQIEITRETSRWSRVMGFMLASLMLLAFSIALTQSFSWPRVLLGFVEVALTYLVGTYLGEMSYYGHFGNLLRARKVPIRIDPEHIDGVGGLKPIGDYYFYQAMIVAIPAIFIAVWVLLIPWWPRDYGHWYEAYVLLLVVTIALEVVAFVIPLHAFHRIILDAQEELHRHADKVSLQIQQIQQQVFAGEADGDPGKSLAASLEALQARYQAIERMRTWPVHPRVRRRFGINNLLLLVPLANDLLHRSVDLKKLLAMISGWQT